MSYNLVAPQRSFIPDPLSEIAVRQFSGSTIAAFAGVVLDGTDQVGGTTPAYGSQPGSTFENLSVSVKLATVGSPAVGSIGVLREALPSGGSPAACVTRSVCVPVTAAGSINSGNLLSLCTISGKLGRFQVAIAGEEIVAQALEDATDGAVFCIRLFGSIAIHA